MSLKMSTSSKNPRPDWINVTTVVAAASVSSACIYFWRKRRQQQQNPPIPRHERFSVAYGDRDLSRGQIIGPRGQAALAPPLPYLGSFLTCLENQCHPDHNPKGHIALCVAENKLVLDILAERFMQTGSTGFSDSSVFTYNSMLGMPVAREAAAYFLARRFLWKSNDASSDPDHALQEIKPKHIGYGTGCAALINHVFFLLGQKGDCCLIPKPYYAAFENDINLIAQIHPFGIDQSRPAEGPTVAELNAAFKQAKRQGYKPKFILITNPNNPLGTIYSSEVMQRMIDWAREKEMHIVVDEIYALSTHSKQSSFESVLSLLNNDLGHDVHMLWAVSKDFGGSGLRCGLLYSQNELLMEGLATLSIFTCVSGPIQYLTAELLTDDSFVDSFLDESRRRIAASYDICTTKLEEMVIPFVKAEAGLFVYVDFSSLLPEKTYEWEEALGKLFFEHARVVLTPGQSQRDPNPGRFRICYAWVTPQVLEIAMERLSRLVAKIRRSPDDVWDPANERMFAGVLE